MRVLNTHRRLNIEPNRRPNRPLPMQHFQITKATNKKIFTAFVILMILIAYIEFLAGVTEFVVYAEILY